MQWILCFQTVTGGIKYYTSDLDNPTYLPFHAFIEYINEFGIKDLPGFKETLDKFRTVLIDLDTKTWGIYNVEKEKDTTFEQLFKLNNKKKEDKQDEFERKLKINSKKQFIKKTSKIKSFIGMKQKDDRTSKR